MAELCQCRDVSHMAGPGLERVVTEMFVCPHCGCEFIEMGDFTEHMREIHFHVINNAKNWSETVDEPFSKIFAMYVLPFSHWR